MTTYIQRANEIIEVNVELKERSAERSINEPSIPSAYMRDPMRNLVRTLLLKGADLDNVIYNACKITSFAPDNKALAAHFYHWEVA